MFQFDRWLFAVKMFLSAMIAFAVSVRLGLPQNYWPVVTCCVLANPYSAGIRSKVVYRFLGTLCGGLVSLILAAMFGSAPVMMIIATGLCGAAAFTIGLLDRTPSSYGFILFGLTLMIVLVSGVDHPERTFDTALARVTEIGLGIVCMTVIDSLILPRSLAPVVRAKLATAVPDIERWIDDVLYEREESARNAHDRLKVITDMTGLSALAGQLRYDTLIGARERQLIFAIQRQMLLLVPLISSIGSRVAAFGPADRESLLVQMRSNWDLVREAPLAAILQSGDLPPLMVPPAGTHWEDLVRQNAAELSERSMRLWLELRLLKAALDRSAALPDKLRASLSTAAPFPLLPDVHLALRVVAGILLAYTAISILWLVTGWSQGPGILLIGVVALAFFGGADQADRLISQFAKFVVVAILLGVVLSYWMLPLAHDFLGFVVVMGLFMLPLAAWAATNPLAILLLATVLSTINLQGRYAPQDFGAYLDASVGNMLGIFIAFVSIMLVRRMGSSHALARFAADGRRDIIDMTRRADRGERDAYLDRALDRIGVMTARLAAAGETEQSADLLKRLSVGADIADLRAATDAEGGTVRASCERLLAAIREEINKATPSFRLLNDVDRALSAAWTEGGGHAHQPLVGSLISIRLALFAKAPAWEPAA